MNLGYWSTGFTGTVNIDLPDIEEPNDTIKKGKYDKIILDDSDEKISVYRAFTGSYSNSINNIYSIDNEDSLFQVLNSNKYNALIDVNAFLRNYESKNLIYRILSMSNYKGFSGIYLNDNDDKRIVDVNKIDSKLNNTPNNDFIMYFSQRNIVGVDIKNQPTNARGLLIVGDSDLYTNVAQAMFRMRKLNQGQTIDIAYVRNSDDLTIHNLINENTENSKIELFIRR